MKKILLISTIFVGILIVLIGYKNFQKPVSYDDLSKINNKIIEYFSTNTTLDDNFCFNYIDEKNNIVIVGLLDNSKEQQNNFKKKIINSKHIKFVQGSKNINVQK